MSTVDGLIGDVDIARGGHLCKAKSAEEPDTDALRA